MNCPCEAAIQHVYGWVRRDEDRSRTRLEELGLPAPLPAPEEMPLEDLTRDLVVVDDVVPQGAQWNALRAERIQVDLD